MSQRSRPQPRQSNGGRPLLNAGKIALATAFTFIALGVWGVAPWAGFGGQYGGVGSIALLSAAMALLSLLGTIVRFQWRPLTAFTALVVLAGSLVILIVFPPRWLLAKLNDPIDGPIFCFETNQPIVALTIDDGLDPGSTPAMLELLAEHNAHATFFVLSSTLDANAQLVERLLEEGHELANHQVRDEPLIAMTDDDAARVITEADTALRRFTQPRWFRPGGGLASKDATRIARRKGCRYVLGSVFPFDSHLLWTRFLAVYVAERPAPGDVIVLHDGAGRGDRTVEVLSQALPRLAERGLKCVTLSELATVAE